ncbi:SulP family inorganic anion transporter [Geobacter sulfurreducens]|uniref:SulP family inorganic anion transporter n=1 Tax=Geobacter sulfurreducens TaxID=35554 RepID=UPI002BD3F59D|nr:SulP family inorganic anion transporter [Geobacter sulfurreducens]HML78836.1 SulP family inorganic anion transporter [Geobacter sulfurreducens]
MAAALQLALLTGMLQLLLGTVRAGLVVSSLSRPAIGGVTSAAVLLMGLSQVKNLPDYPATAVSQPLSCPPAWSGIWPNGPADRGNMENKSTFSH